MSLLWSLSVLCINDPVVISSCWIEAAKFLVFSSSWSLGDAKDAALFLYSSAMLGVEGDAHGVLVSNSWRLEVFLLDHLLAGKKNVSNFLQRAVDLWLNPTKLLRKSEVLSAFIFHCRVLKRGVFKGMGVFLGKPKDSVWGIFPPLQRLESMELVSCW